MAYKAYFPRLSLDNENNKALIAMSGGVDSGVAALIMTESGFDCTGCTMKLYENEDACIPESRTCCSLKDVDDARAIATRLGMPYYVFNFKDEFKETVIKELSKIGTMLEADFRALYGHENTSGLIKDMEEIKKEIALIKAQKSWWGSAIAGWLCVLSWLANIGIALFALLKGGK